MGRNRKLLTGVAPIGGPSLKSRREARRVTSAYHIIRNEMQSIGTSSSLSNDEKQSKKAKLEAQLVDIGGTNRYQEASIVSTKHFKTSRWVISSINTHLSLTVTATATATAAAIPVVVKRDSPNSSASDYSGPIAISQSSSASSSSSSSAAATGRYNSNKRLDVLEVGAINIQLQQTGNFNVRAIDVNSQHPSIEEIDFFDVPPLEQYDCVVCSMVVNCVHTPTKRGDMLIRLRGHLKTDQSLLLLVLPSRCINSRYVGRAKFSQLLHTLGYSFACDVKCTPHLLFYTLRRGALLIGKEKEKNKEVGDTEEMVGRKRNRSNSSSNSNSTRDGNEEAVVEEDNEYWRIEAKQRLVNASKSIRRHFNAKLDATVPPNEFALGFLL